MTWASLIALLVKNLPAVQETWVRFLGQEDPLEKEMATHSSILAWRIPWIEDPGGLQSMGLQRVRHSWATNVFTFTSGNWGQWEKRQFVGKYEEVILDQGLWESRQGARCLLPRGMWGSREEEPRVGKGRTQISTSELRGLLLLLLHLSPPPSYLILLLEQISNRLHRKTWIPLRNMAELIIRLALYF